MSRMAPPPGSPPPPVGEFGGGAPLPANLGPGTPAPPTAPNPSVMQDTTDVMTIVNAVRGLAERHPQAGQLAMQINDLMQQMQMMLVQSLPPAEVPAPPV